MPKPNKYDAQGNLRPLADVPKPTTNYLYYGYPAGTRRTTLGPVFDSELLDLCRPYNIGRNAAKRASKEWARRLAEGLSRGRS